MIRTLMAGLLAIGVASPAAADVVARAEVRGVVVTLTDEKCALPVVVNLPFRATWLEGGVLTEGCFGVFPGSLLLGYFADKTVVPMSPSAFRKATST